MALPFEVLAHSHQARGHHMQQERGHTQEDGRQDGAQHLLLADLVVQHRVGGLFGAAVGGGAAERGQLPCHGIDHRGVRSLRRQLQRGVNEIRRSY